MPSELAMTSSTCNLILAAIDNTKDDEDDNNKEDKEEEEEKQEIWRETPTRASEAVKQNKKRKGQ